MLNFIRETKLVIEAAVTCKFYRLVFGQAEKAEQVWAEMLQELETPSYRYR